MKSAPLAMFVLLLFLGGCRRAPVPDPVKAAPDNTPTGDAKILLDLDYYEPMYKVDADGRVVRLRLTGRHLPTSVMTEVGKLTELRGLDLYGASISDDGLAELKDLQKLTNIGLGGTQITEKGVEHLAKLEALRYVWLPKQRCEEEAAEKLKRAGVNVYPQ
jgi:hypothetical protein